MSERDEDIRVILAGLAMNGLLAGQTNHHADYKVDRFGSDGTTKLTFAEDIARDAVAHADALIKAINESR